MKIYKVYKEIGFNNFKKLAVLLSLICDLSIIAYIYNKTVNGYQLIKPIIVEAFVRQGVDYELIEPQMIHQMFMLLSHSITFMLFLILLVHIIVYLLFLKGKKTPRRYIVLLSWIGTPGLFIASISLLFVGSYLVSLFALILGVLYLMILLGFQCFKNGDKEECYE